MSKPKPWSSRATFKYQRGMLVNLTGLPGVWKIYSPHPESGKYWCEPHDASAHALLSLTGTDSRVLTFTPTSVQRGGTPRGCAVAVEHGMVVAPTGEITRVTRNTEDGHHV